MIFPLNASDLSEHHLKGILVFSNYPECVLEARVDTETARFDGHRASKS